jgi:hypothetical protein
MYLRICWPSTVIPQPVSHVFISQNIIERKGYILTLKELQKSLCESAFGGIYRTFDEKNNLRFIQNTFDFWMPDCFIFLKFLPEGDYFLFKGIKYDSNILCCDSF